MSEIAEIKKVKLITVSCDICHKNLKMKIEGDFVGKLDMSKVINFTREILGFNFYYNSSDMVNYLLCEKCVEKNIQEEFRK